MKNNSSFNDRLAQILAQDEFKGLAQDPNVQEFLSKVSYNFDQYRKKIRLLETALRVSNEEIKNYKEASEIANANSINNSRLAAVGEMAANISHEINNPLAIILGSVDVISSALEDEDINPLVEKQLEKISTTVTRVSKIITMLKKISHNQGAVEETKEEIVSEILNDIVLVLIESMKKSQIRLNINIGDKLKETKAFIPQTGLSQVISNLLTNSKQAVEDLVNSEKWINISLEDSENYLMVRIDNGGPVIPVDIRQKIFNPFFTTKPVGKGTGIGLHISKKIMTNIGGDIVLDDSKIFPSFVIMIPKTSLANPISA